MGGPKGATRSASRVRPALRPLGPRGEGWVGIQTAIAIVVLDSPALDPWRSFVPGQVVLTAVGFAICFGAVLLFAWGAATLGPSFSIWVSPKPEARLVTDGPYRWTRHPICTAQAIFGFGWAAAFTSPLAAGLALIYAVYLDRFKLRREEETLLARYPEYEAYARATTHRMLPMPPSGRAGLPDPR